MTKVSELVSQNVGNQIINFQTWGSILYNVKAYGAKGDGVTDDTTSIQNCINAVKVAGGGIVFFPDGTYMLKSVQSIGMTARAIQDPNLYVNSVNNIKFVGTGNVILTTGDGLPATRTEMLFLYKCNNVEVSGIQFKGNNAGLDPSNNNCGLGGVSITGLYVHDCQFYGFQGSYFGFSWLFNSVIERCKFTVSGGTAIDVAFLQNVIIRNCYMTGSGLGSNSLGTTGISIAYDSPNAAYNETGIFFVNGFTNNVTIEENLITAFGTGMNLSDLIDTHVINNNIFNNYIGSDSQSWGIVLGSTQSNYTMEGIVIFKNSIYENGSTVSGGGMTIGVGTAIGVCVDVSDNDFFDNSHIGLNVGSTLVTLHGSKNRFYNRSNTNQTTMVGSVANLSTRSLFTNNEGYTPASGIITIPTAIGSANKVTNNNPSAAIVYQAAGTGLHLVRPDGVDYAISEGNQSTFRLPAYWSAYFATVNTTQWHWIYE